MKVARNNRERVVLASIVVAAVLGVGVGGCIQGSPDQEQRGAGSASRHVGKRAPRPGHRIDATLGDRVELLGYDLEPDAPRPGQKVRLTWYWHCRRPLGGTWRIFTHLVNRSTGEMCLGCNLDDESVDNLRALYPPGRWQAGEYVSDVQYFTLPDTIPFGEAEIRIGVYQGSSRLEVTDGPSDGDRRVPGPHFTTGWTPPPVPELAVPHTTAALTIDGRLDESDWSRSAQTAAFVNATNGKLGRPVTRARLLHDDEHFFIAFECEDDNIHSTYTKRDDELWRQDAVEVFIDPPGKGRDYFEFQVSPAGQLFDTLVHQHPRRDDSYDGAPRAGVQRQGSLNDDSDEDRGWTVELAVPIARLGEASVAPGSVWRLNLFRLDDRLVAGRAFLAWSPPLSNTTHVPSRFGEVTFGAAASPAGGLRAGSTPDAGTEDR
jgi:hypothetical protein